MDYKEKVIAMLNSKELSQEQKEKLEDIFPELAESEDEKVRKAIGYAIGQSTHSDGTLINGVSSEEALAWLEKQGEKTEPIEGFDTEFERQISHLVASAINREHEYNKGYIKWAAQSLIEYAKREIEKQGEQKPIKEHDACDFCEDRYGCASFCPTKLIEEQNPAWGGEDEKIRQFLIHEVTETSDEIMSYRNMNKKDVLAWLEKQSTQIDLEEKDSWEYIQEFIDKFGHFPKDCDELNVCVDYVLDKTKHYVNKKELKKVEQKPSWSDEDEEMYKEVLTDIIYAKNDLKAKECHGLSKRAIEAFNWFSNRYKSLRPQSTWRPSEEQMKVLNEVLNFAANHESLHWNDYIFGTLNNLIIQLKKLRED